MFHAPVRTLLSALATSAAWLEYRFAQPHDLRFYTLTSGAEPGADPGTWVVKGSTDGRQWKVLDARAGERFSWRSQTRPFELDRPGRYSHVRIEFAPGTVGLAEVELLTREPAAATPLEADIEPGAAGRAGETVPVRVKLANWGEAPLSGAVTASVPDGWTVEPASAPFGPLAGGGGQATVTLGVGVPAGAEPGGYAIDVTATSGAVRARASGTVNVVGDVIEFTPGTTAEEPWLFDAGASQLDGEVYDGRARFADNERAFVYRFPASGGTLRLDLHNQFLVQVSADGQSWRTVLEETRRITDGSNRGWREVGPAELPPAGGPLYVRIADSFPDDGWGGWLARLRLGP
jgi:NPCBM-associated, NEW3 domain of alpha-galactosidase